ncbi:MAG TPA: sensor histidine kinase [Rugosimonospora sp.]|jgi:signal transduction histidine kinase
MTATAHSPRPPLRDRVPAAVWTALGWGGAVVLPLILVFNVPGGPNGAPHELGAPEVTLRYLEAALMVALPAGLLRRRPLTTLALMLAGSSLVAVTVHAHDVTYVINIRFVQLVAIDLAVGVIAANRARRVSVPAALAALAVQVAVEFAVPTAADTVARPLIPTLAMVAAWLIGNSVRARRGYAEALRAQVAAEAITAERLRIARELHDMVAHSIGIIAIQAGMGSRVMDTQPAQAREALRAIEATSRETLAGLRRVVGGLRRAEPGPAPRPASLDPVPGLADVDRLAATTAAGAGVRVEVRWRGDRRPVPGDIDLSAYRIIQEAVTNVVRHAGTGECRVTVERRDAELRIEVLDDGRGCAVAGTGYGITGMRERVGLLHGEFSAGPRAEGGFRVAATLPLPEPITDAGTPAGPVAAESRPAAAELGSVAPEAR